MIYVVDSADRERIPTARAELLAMLAEEELQDCKLLVFANKQDQPDAMSAAEVSEALGLDTLKGRQWTIMKSCAIKGEGLEEGLDWYVTYSLSMFTCCQQADTCSSTGLLRSLVNHNNRLLSINPHTQRRYLIAHPELQPSKTDRRIRLSMPMPCCTRIARGAS